MSIFICRVSSGAGPGISGLIQLVIDSVNAAPIADFSIANTGGWQNWIIVNAPIGTKIISTYSVYVKFANGQLQDFVNMNWFMFKLDAPVSPNPPRPIPGPTPDVGKYKTVVYYINWVG
jgi:hypothetical protein